MSDLASVPGPVAVSGSVLDGGSQGTPGPFSLGAQTYHSFSSWQNQYAGYYTPTGVHPGALQTHVEHHSIIRKWGCRGPCFLSRHILMLHMTEDKKFSKIRPLQRAGGCGALGKTHQIILALAGNHQAERASKGIKGRTTVWERVSWTPLKPLQSKSHSKAAALSGLHCTFRLRVRDWVFSTPDRRFVSCTRVRTPEAPLKLFWIYCYFLKAFFF